MAHTPTHTKEYRNASEVWCSIPDIELVENVRNDKKRDDEYVRVSEKFASGKTDVKLRG